MKISTKILDFIYRKQNQKISELQVEIDRLRSQVYALLELKVDKSTNTKPASIYEGQDAKNYKKNWRG